MGYQSRTYTRDGDPRGQEQERILRAAAQVQRPRLQIAVEGGDGDEAEGGRGGCVVDEPERAGDTEGSV